MKAPLPNIKTIYKNFTNLLMYEKEFRIKTEWHFFATSHGKNACNGVGGGLKRDLQLLLAFRGQFIFRYWIHINYMILLRVKFPVPHVFLLISSKLMFFQNFWPPDMKMPDTLKKEEKHISLSQWWHYFNALNLRSRFSSIKFD